MTLLLPAVCLFACILNIGFEANQQQKLTLKTKLLASLAFVGFAWELGAMDSPYGQVLFLGLLLSMVGDGLLAIKGHSNYFLLGIVAFLLTHIAYSAAFVIAGTNNESFYWVIPTVLLIMLLVLYWLWSHLNGLFKTVVPIYILAIGLMLVLAWCNQSVAAKWWIVSGATLFAISDLFVARNRFILSDLLNRMIGIPAYYLAQLMLAYSISLV